jgi:HPr kinase/phosphorylase
MLPVQGFYKKNKETLGLQIINDEKGLNRKISTSDILRPALAFNGFTDYLYPGAVLLIDYAEQMFLESMSPQKQKKAINSILGVKIPCIIISSKVTLSKYFIEKADEKLICIFKATTDSTKIIHVISDYLDFKFAPKTNIHGTLVDVYGMGVLFVGESGIGKSEIALDLVERGHRLVADDLVICTRKSKVILMGEGREFAEHHLEIRGIGIVDVKRLFGIRSVRVQKRIEVIVELVHYDSMTDYDRIGLKESFQEINGVLIPKVILPINPGKNVTVLTETIALTHLLKVFGFNPAQEFNDNLIKAMKKRQKEKRAYLDFLEEDYE